MLTLTLSLLLLQADVEVAVEVDAGVPEPVVVDAGMVAPVAALPAEDAAHWSVWTQPLGMAGYGAGAALTGASAGVSTTPQLVYLPLGAGFVLPKGIELNVELTVTFQGATNFLTPRFGFWVSAGPVIHSGARPFNGFFIQPKLVGAYQFSLGEGQCGQFCTPSDTGLVALGIDAGYQLTFRHLYIAFAAGFGIGAGNYRELEIVTPWLINFGGLQTNNPIAPVVLFNLNLVRIGGWN